MGRDHPGGGVGRRGRLGYLGLFSSSVAGSVVIALLAAGGVAVLFELTQRSKTTCDEVDRTTLAAAAEASRLGNALPAKP